MCVCNLFSVSVKFFCFSFVDNLLKDLTQSQNGEEIQSFHFNDLKNMDVMRVQGFSKSLIDMILKMNADLVDTRAALMKF